MSPTVFGFSLSTSGLLPYPPSPKSIHQLTRSYLNIRPSVVRILYLGGWSTRRTSLTCLQMFGYKLAYHRGVVYRYRQEINASIPPRISEKLQGRSLNQMGSCSIDTAPKG